MNNKENARFRAAKYLSEEFGIHHESDTDFSNNFFNDILDAMNGYAQLSQPTQEGERIICAAIKLVDSGKVYYGHRHPHCIEAKNGELSWKLSRQEILKIESIQGFVTSKNRFVDRKEAFEIAKLNNQIIDLSNTRGTDLYSEDLY